METFVLAAVSLTISISLLIKKKKSPTHRAFAFLCLALFFQKAGAFFHEAFIVDIVKTFSYLGALSIPPLLISFCRIFLNREVSLSRRIVLSTAVVSFILGVLFLISGFTVPFITVIIYLYNGSVCHDTGTDAESGDTVFSNFDTHHSTGIGQGIIPGSALDCSLCHDSQANENLKIRACEKCHAPSSLHNIQIDSNGDGRIEPGTENANYGHIGNNKDCLGCHLGSSGSDMDTRGRLNNVNRHHQLVVTRKINCLDCHSLVLNKEGIFEFEDFRYCPNCHGRANHQRW